MPDEIVTPSPDPKAASADPTNLKAEMDRKIGNLESSLKKSTDALAAQLQALNQKYNVQPATIPQHNAKKPFRERFYEDEDAAVAELTQDILKKVEDKNVSTARQNQILGQLYTAYPELADVNNDLTKRALEIYNALPKEDRTSPISYKVAVQDAAEELGVLPMTKRKNDESEDADFVMGGGQRQTLNKKKGTGELPAEMLEFAAHLGLDVSDEKVVNSIKSNHRNSQDWQRYQPIKRK